MPIIINEWFGNYYKTNRNTDECLDELIHNFCYFLFIVNIQPK